MLPNLLAYVVPRNHFAADCKWSALGFRGLAIQHVRIVPENLWVEGPDSGPLKCPDSRQSQDKNQGSGGVIDLFLAGAKP